MTGTWHWPELNSRRAIGSRPRPIISMPSIISGWCLPMEERDRAPATKVSRIGFWARTPARRAHSSPKLKNWTITEGSARGLLFSDALRSGLWCPLTVRFSRNARFQYVGII
jgi:hypothetical protein